MNRRPKLAIAILVALLLCLPAAVEAKPPSGLAPGKSLRPGQSLLAGGAELTMRHDGDLALFYVPLRARTPLAKRAKAPGASCRTRRCRFLRPRRLWHTGTAGHAGARLTMRADGAAVVRAGNRVLWSSRTRRRGASLRLQRNGNLAVLAPRPAASGPAATASATEAELETLWRSGTETPEYVGSQLAAGASLEPNQYLQSPNGQYELDMTPQGWMALWVRGAGPCPIFVTPSSEAGTGVARQPGSVLRMEPSGLLALRSPEPGEPVLWAMHNYGNPHESAQPTPVPGSHLALENDGNLAVLGPGGETIWETETERIRGPVLCPGESLWFGQILASVYSGPGSQYQGGAFLEIATANGGRGSELNLVAADQHLGVTHIYRERAGPSAEGMYLQMQNRGALELLLEGGDGVPNWQSGTTIPSSFAAVRGLSLAIYAPFLNSEGERAYYAIYEQPDADEETTTGISQAEKLAMSLAPMG